MKIQDQVLKKRPAAKRDPAHSRRRLLAAARDVFSRKGLGGARVDEIAALSGVNKQLVYYYFGNKKDLYLAVLEKMYEEIREQELKLDLDHLEPIGAMEKLVEFTFDYFTKNPHFVPLLGDENLHKAQHLKTSKVIAQLHSPLVETIRTTLARGEASGVFRRGLDPVQVYVSFAGLGFFYYSNIHTLSVIFGRDLQSDAAVAERRAHVIEFALRALLSE